MSLALSVCRSSVADVEVTESSQSFVKATSKALKAVSGRHQPAACCQHSYCTLHMCFSIYINICMNPTASYMLPSFVFKYNQHFILCAHCLAAHCFLSQAAAHVMLLKSPDVCFNVCQESSSACCSTLTDVFHNARQFCDQ